MEDHANLSRAAVSGQTRFGELIGESAPMRQLHELIARISQGSSPVLLLGETGTGKELVARAIHFAGVRREKAFIPVDCAALTPTLVESELFGFVKGAFTGAQHSRRGLLHVADEGTILLDEIGELPLFLQAKLLRSLQEKEIRPVGSTERIPINVRVIAATNRDLEAGVGAGTFRQDLFYRLNVLQISLPALRDRKIDIPLLVAYFLEKFSDPLRRVHAISDEALRRLMAYDWPGNVRELENAVEHGIAMSSGRSVEVRDLPSSVSRRPCEERDFSTARLWRDVERRAIYAALEETMGDKISAARVLGIGKTTLYRKLKKYERKRREQGAAD